MAFWRDKPLEALSVAEWESLCDGCGQCCLQKLEDEDSGQIAVTRIACRQLDLGTGRCGCYPTRLRQEPRCVDLRSGGAGVYRWLPATCAYRLRAEGKPLPQWHPLRSGSQDSVRQAGRSVLAYAVKQDVAEHEWEDHIIGWLD